MLRKHAKHLLVGLVLCTAASTATAQVGGGSCPEDTATSTCNRGPDITVYQLSGVSRFPSSGDDNGFVGFSIGTDSCNIGDTPSNWCDDNRCVAAIGGTEKHPVIAGNLYRVMDGRLEQLGKSWLKHGFFSTNSTDFGCGQDGVATNPPSCVQPPEGGDQLGVGCTDFYGSSLNGSRPLGMRSEVNPTTGLFEFPYTEGGTSSGADQQIRVATSDLDPASNPGAVYFAEGHYIVDDDGMAKNANGDLNAWNNASYRSVNVSGSGSSVNISFTGSTTRERSALYAWRDVHPDVEIVNADFVGTAALDIPERFEVARRIVANRGGGFTTILAVRNMNSDRAARSLTITFPSAAGISNPTFTDVDSHSGEQACASPQAPPTGDCSDGTPIVGNDWVVNTSNPNQISWTGGAWVDGDETQNALRWGTTFTFSFDSVANPGDATFVIGLYKDGGVGDPGAVTAPFSNSVVFFDGFESSDTTSWSSAQP